MSIFQQKTGLNGDLAGGGKVAKDAGVKAGKAEDARKSVDDGSVLDGADDGHALARKLGDATLRFAEAADNAQAEATVRVGGSGNDTLLGDRGNDRVESAPEPVEVAVADADDVAPVKAAPHVFADHESHYHDHGEHDESAGGSQELDPDAAIGGFDFEFGPPTHSIDGDNLEELMGQLNRGGKHWSDDYHTGATLRIAFPQSLSDFPEDHLAQWDWTGPSAEGLDPFTAFDVGRQAAAIQALNHWAEIADLDFDIVAPGEEADIYFFGREYKEGGGYSNGVQETLGSAVRINTASGSWDSMDPGGSGYKTMLHEIGHSLGLSHPGPYDIGDGAEYTSEFAEYIQDTTMYSLMSYFGGANTGYDGGGTDAEILTARTHDMWVMQELYGANWTTRTGDTTYGFNASGVEAGGVYDFDAMASNFGPVLTIWDAGGDNDWLDLSGDSNDVVLNLTPGTFSSTHGMTYNLSLAFAPNEAGPGGYANHWIENARGGSGNDLIIGNDVANVLEGGAGDDTLTGGFGVDDFHGGTGSDTTDFSYSNADWTFDLADPWNQTASNASGSEEMTHIENIVGANGDDLIIGSYLDNRLEGGAGNDTVRASLGQDEHYGGAGIDELDLSSIDADWTVHMLNNTATYAGKGGLDDIYGFERVRGGDGADTVIGSHGSDTVWGGGGADVIEGNWGDDLLLGESGSDRINGGEGNDFISGGSGYDTAIYHGATSGVVVDLALNGVGQMTGGAGEDTLASIERVEGSAHGDVLAGNGGANFVHGEGGNDVLFGRGGNDWVHGGSGDDIVEGGDGDDILTGGEGEDAASYFFASAGVIVDLSNYGAQNTVGAGTDVISSVEHLIGSFHADWLIGDEGGNRITAGAGNDILSGGAGADSLYGGEGNDVLNGGLGNDLLDGGAGIDWVHYNTNAPDGVEVDLSKGLQWTKVGTDTIVNVENVFGSFAADDIRGDDGANELSGSGGDDTIVGGGGNDTITGGTGDDMIYVGTDAPYSRPDDFKFEPADEPIDSFVFAGFDGRSDPVESLRLASGSGGGTLTTATREGETTYFVSRSVLTADTSGGASRAIGGVKIDPGSGADVIRFSGAWGDDEVFGFSTGVDKLDFSAIKGLDLIDLDLEDTVDGVLVSYGSNSVLLHDVTQNALTDGDFIV